MHNDKMPVGRKSFRQDNKNELQHPVNHQHIQYMWTSQKQFNGRERADRPRCNDRLIEFRFNIPLHTKYDIW